MGKALLLIVTATALFGGASLFQTQESASETRRAQASYQEEVLAREIARSAYNVTVALARDAGADLNEAQARINGRTSDGRPDPFGRKTGSHQGGTYEARATVKDGHALDLHVTGYYGTASHTINEEHRIQVLTVKQPSTLTVEFIESMAGYCSSVWLERLIPVAARQTGDPVDTDGDGYVALDPVMIFTPGNGRDGSRETFSETLQTGTRLNFFIGVDKNCSEEGVYAATYDASDYDHSHYALNDYEPYVTVTEESIWAMVEQHPTDDQRWRIGWEDQRRTEWDDPDLNKARSSSLQKTKIEGYDGDGWPTTNAEGYRALRDYGSRPDFSDQVVEVTLTPLPGSPSEEPA
ncbi:MAG: hypothetical protein AAFP18_02730 [Bacteroidota bacterium]